MFQNKERCLRCENILSRFNLYRLCYVHQNNLLKKEFPVCLRTELRNLKARHRRESDCSDKEAEQIIHVFSWFLQEYSEEEIAGLVEQPEVMHESLSEEDEVKAENFAEVIMFLRGKREEILQPFLKN